MRKHFDFCPRDFEWKVHYNDSDYKSVENPYTRRLVLGLSKYRRPIKGNTWFKRVFISHYLIRL